MCQILNICVFLLGSKFFTKKKVTYLSNIRSEYLQRFCRLDTAILEDLQNKYEEEFDENLKV